MTLSPEQAIDALRDIETAESRSRELRGYQEGSPHFVMWGIIWIIGYAACGYSPGLAPIWIPLGLIGMAATVFLARRSRSRPIGRKVGLTWLIVMMFWAATYAVLQPHTSNQFGAFPAILIATAYGMAGIWILPRYLWLGLGVFALTLFGFFFAASWFSYWMAAVGGGGLILGGLWLRKA